MTTRDEVIAAAKEAGLDVRSNEVVTGYYYEEITSEIVRLYVLAFKAGMERAVEVCEKEKSIVRAENARLRVDAERYRWLRDTQEGKTVRIMYRREWDKAIDEAIRKENYE